MRFNPLAYKSTLRGDLVITLINGMGVFVGVFILFGLMARGMGMDALGDFLLVRRTTFESLGMLVLGLNLGLPYYLSKEDDRSYGASALMLVVIVTLPLTGIITGAFYLGILPGFPKELVFPFLVFTSGYAIQMLTYALLRGHMNMLGANLLQFTGTGLIPIAAFFLFRYKGVPTVLIAAGLGTSIFSGVLFFLRMGRGSYILRWEQSRNLLKYGIQRVPSFLAQFILMGGVPLLILQSSTKPEIAYVNSGISLMRFFLVIIGPIGIVLLPRVSKALATGQKARVAKGLDALGRTILLIGLPLAMLMRTNSATLLKIWLGSSEKVGYGIIGIIILALPFYLITVVFRSPIDAASVKGYNSIAYGIAALALLFTFFALRSVGFTSVHAGMCSFIAGHLTAAIGSLYNVYRCYSINLIDLRYLSIILSSTIISLFFFYMTSLIAPGVGSLLIGGIALILSLGLYFAKSQADWVVGLRDLVITR